MKLSRMYIRALLVMPLCVGLVGAQMAASGQGQRSAPKSSSQLLEAFWLEAFDAPYVQGQSEIVSHQKIADGAYEVNAFQYGQGEPALLGDGFFGEVASFTSSLSDDIAYTAGVLSAGGTEVPLVAMTSDVPTGQHSAHHVIKILTAAPDMNAAIWKASLMARPMWEGGAGGTLNSTGDDDSCDDESDDSSSCDDGGGPSCKDQCDDDFWKCKEAAEEQKQHDIWWCNELFDNQFSRCPERCEMVPDHLYDECVDRCEKIAAAMRDECIEEALKRFEMAVRDCMKEQAACKLACH